MDIPTDKEMALGISYISPATADDMAPTVVPNENPEEPRRRGRKAYPRDEQGRIIRPDGSVGPRPQGARRTGGGGLADDLAEREAVVANRKAREQRYNQMIREEANPLVLDIGCFIAGVPKQQVLIPVAGGFRVNPMGEALMFNDIQITIFSKTLARMHETPAGQQLMDKLEGISPYAFLGLSAVMLLMYAMNLFALRQMQMTVAKRAMEGMQQVQEPTNGKPGVSLNDMLSNLFSQGKRQQPAAQEEESEVLVANG